MLKPLNFFFMKWLLTLLFFHSTLFGLTVTSGLTSISSSGIDTNPQLAISPNGQAIAAWTKSFPNQVETAYFNGRTWGTPVVLDVGSFSQVGIDRNGNAFVIWLNTNNNQIFTSRYTAATGAWSSPRQLSTSGVNGAPQIAVNLQGNAVAVWVLSSPLQLVAATYNVSTGVWSSPTALVAGTGSFPKVALDNSNNGVIIFTDNQFGIEAFTITVP